MIKSMTGYGLARFESEKLNAKVEIKTLNGKFAEFNLRVPRLLSSKELQIRNMLNQHIVRGTIQCNITWQYKAEASVANAINGAVLANYIKEIREATKNINFETQGIYSQVLTLPEVLVPNDRELAEEDWTLTEKLIIEACASLNVFRSDEGKTIETHLKACINNLQQNLDKVATYEPARLAAVREKIQTQLNKYILPENIDNSRLEQEIVYYIEKLDIAEEKTRLQQHLTYFLQNINEAESGKKLGFIAQEMLREINTMGSKANHFEIQQLVVGMKDELEKVKEQVLNVL